MFGEWDGEWRRKKRKYLEKEINLSARRQRIERGIFGDGKYLVRRGEEEQRRKEWRRRSCCGQKVTV